MKKLLSCIIVYSLTAALTAGTLWSTCPALVNAENIVMVEDGTSATGTAAGETSVNEPSVSGSSENSASGNGTAGSETAATGTAAGETSVNEPSVSGSSEDGASGNGTAGSEIAGNGTAAGETSVNEPSVTGSSEDGASADESSEDIISADEEITDEDITGETVVDETADTDAEDVTGINEKDDAEDLSAAMDQEQTAADSAELKKLCREAEEAFEKLASGKTIMALIYLTDSCPVYEKPDTDSSCVTYLESGHTVIVTGVSIGWESAPASGETVAATTHTASGETVAATTTTASGENGAATTATASGETGAATTATASGETGAATTAPASGETGAATTATADPDAGDAAATTTDDTSASVSQTDFTVMYEICYDSDDEECAGWVESRYLAYSDEEWISWQEEYLSEFGDEGVYCLGASDTDNGTSADIEAFPVSYREGLYALKKAHSNWTFVKLDTGLDFSASVTAESQNNRSWIQKTSSADSSWIGSPASQSGWYLATEAGIAHYMDPRNFFTESGIFQFEQLTYNKSYHTESALDTFLAGTFMTSKNLIPDDTQTYAHAFFTIGKSGGVSPFHLASRVYQEQGSGKSSLISGTYSGYEGYYNYFNVGATGTTDKAVIVNGLTYAKNQGWNTRYKSLQGGAATIGKNYILKAQDTIYLEKFNVDPATKNYSRSVYNHQYMQNIQAPASESASTKKMYADVGSLNSAFVFKIPVYSNMPVDTALESISIADEYEDITLRRPDTVLDDDTVSALASEGLSEYAQYNFSACDLSGAITCTPEDHTEDGTITWTSSNTKVAKVDSTGLVTAVGTGNAVIRATAAGATAKPYAECTVHVIAPVTGIKITGTEQAEVWNVTSNDSDEDTDDTDDADDSDEDTDVISVPAGCVLSLSADETPSDAATVGTVEWTSSDTNTAQVTDGRVVTASGTSGSTASGSTTSGSGTSGSGNASTSGSTTVTITASLDGFSDSLTLEVYTPQLTIYDSTGTKTLVSTQIAYGSAIDETLFPALSDVLSDGEDADSCLLLGWYTGPDGTGVMAADGSGTAVNDFVITDRQTELFPFIQEKGNGFYAVPVGDRVYTGSDIKPTVLVYDSNDYEDADGAQTELVPLVQGTDYKVSYSNCKNVNKAGAKQPTITIQGCGNYSGKVYLHFNILACDLSDPEITANDVILTYSGKTQKTGPEVYRGTKKLKAGTDYTLKYPSTVTGAYCKAGRWPVNIVGKGGYSGTITVYEDISQRISLSRVSVGKIANMSFADYAPEDSERDSWEGVIPSISDGFLSYKGTPLTISTDGGETGDVTVSFTNNKAVGTASATFTAVDGSGYYGSRTVNYRITGTSISGAKVTGIVSKTYTGNAEDVHQDPETITLTLKQTVLVRSTDGVTGDYVISGYKNDTKAGTCTVTFTGINAYYGTLKKTYTINKINLAKLWAERTIGSTGNSSDSTESASGSTGNSSAESESASDSTGNLADGTGNSDISVLYYMLQECGDQPTQSAPGEVVTESSGMTDIEVPCLKGGSRPHLVINCGGRTLTEGTDYSLSWDRCTAVTTEDMITKAAAGDTSKLPRLTVKGKGNYSGTITLFYRISALALGDETSGVTMTVPDVVYKGKPGTYKAVPVLTDADGKKLAAKKDYTDVTYTYARDYTGENAILQKSGEYADRLAGEAVGAADIPGAGVKIRVTVTGAGNYAYTDDGSPDGTADSSTPAADDGSPDGTADSSTDSADSGSSVGRMWDTFTVIKADISSVKVSIKNKTYLNGRAVTLITDPDPEVCDLKLTYGKTVLVYGSDYEIVPGSYANNTKKGTATVQIRGLHDEHNGDIDGNFGGVRTVKFTIGSRLIFW